MQNISEDTLRDIGGGCASFLPLDASGMKAVSFTGRRLPYQYFFMLSIYVLNQLQHQQNRTSDSVRFAKSAGSNE
jgi:hypothetical protein